MKSPTQNDTPNQNQSNPPEENFPLQNYPQANQANNYTKFISDIETSMANLKEECEILLQRKRQPSPYLNYTFNTFLAYRPNPHLCVNNPRDYPYLLKIFDDYIFSNRSEMNTLINNKGIKRIGISAKDIFKIPKYKIDIKNIPKFGHISDSQIFVRPLIEHPINSYDRSFLLNRNPTNYSTIEKQNREAKKLLEQRREKYKDLSNEVKEKMDNEKLKQYWVDMAKHEVPKFPRIYQKYKNETEAFNKRLSTLIHKELKKKVNKIQRSQKEYPFRAKKLQKEMLIYWKKREKEMADVQKKKEKLEIDKKKKEDELQEQIIQKKRMEYLLKQSDIYSIMMYKHLGAFMPKDDNNIENNNINNENKSEQKDDENYKKEIISGKSVLVNKKTNKILFNSIQVDIDENEARKNVNSLINQQRQKAAEFDKNINVIRKT